MNTRSLIIEEAVNIVKGKSKTIDAKIIKKLCGKSNPIPSDKAFECLSKLIEKIYKAKEIKIIQLLISRKSRKTANYPYESVIINTLTNGKQQLYIINDYEAAMFFKNNKYNVNDILNNNSQAKKLSEVIEIDDMDTAAMYLIDRKFDEFINANIVNYSNYLIKPETAPFRTVCLRAKPSRDIEYFYNCLFDKLVKQKRIKIHPLDIIVYYEGEVPHLILIGGVRGKIKFFDNSYSFEGTGFDEIDKEDLAEILAHHKYFSVNKTI